MTRRFLINELLGNFLAKICSVWAFSTVVVPLHAITYLICNQENILTTRKAGWFIILVVSACLSVCLSVLITFERLDVESLHLYIEYSSREYLSGLYMKVIGSRSRSQEQKGQKSLFPQCKNFNKP